MKNRISLMGLLGLLGLLGLITDNPGFYGFFGFFGFFGFAKILPDEMFKQNVNKAAKNAFFTGLIIYPTVVVIGTLSLFPFALVFTFGFAVNFAVQILVFSFSLSKYEKSGGVR
ncbi:MAG: DUF3796 domain-containing protein [Clostridia bacterium]|nr:DUF3796 domain-containing protein [Clostridiales bacterium]